MGAVERVVLWSHGPPPAQAARRRGWERLEVSGIMRVATTTAPAQAARCGEGARRQRGGEGGRLPGMWS